MASLRLVYASAGSGLKASHFLDALNRRHSSRESSALRESLRQGRWLGNGIRNLGSRFFAASLSLLGFFTVYTPFMTWGRAVALARPFIAFTPTRFPRARLPIPLPSRNRRRLPPHRSCLRRSRESSGPTHPRRLPCRCKRQWLP